MPCPTDHKLTVLHAAAHSVCRLKFYYRSHFIGEVALLLVSFQHVISRGVNADFETHFCGITVAMLPITAVLPHHFLNLFPSPRVSSQEHNLDPKSGGPFLPCPFRSLLHSFPPFISHAIPCPLSSPFLSSTFLSSLALLPSPNAARGLGSAAICLSVCLFVTFVDHVKTNKDIFEIFSPSIATPF